MDKLKTEIGEVIDTLEAKTMRTIHIVSSVFSVILSPMLMPTYGMVIAFQLSTYQMVFTVEKVKVISAIAMLTCIIPAIIFIAMKHFGIISDVHLNLRRERFFPYMIICVCYVVSALYLFNINAPTWMWMFLFGAAIASIISLVVNFYWKISGHMAGIGGIIGLLCKINSYGDAVFDLMPIICVLIIAAGILGTSRIAMERHTLWQVIAGVFNGFLCVYLI